MKIHLSMDKVYDGNAVSNPTFNKTGSTNEVMFTWYQKTKVRGWQELKGAPTSVGRYKVVASVAEDGNYKAATAEKEFFISIADNEWTKKLSIKDWTYGETASAPSAVAKFGKVVCIYSDSEDGTYTENKPVNAGTYYVKATVEGTENYKGLVSEPVKFEIRKANPEYTGETEFTATYEDKLSSIELPDGLRWKDGSLSVGDAGTHEFEAVYNPDSKNYNDLAVKVKVHVKKANSSIKFKDDVAFDKVYDNNAVVVTEEQIERTGSTGKVSFKFEKKVNNEWKKVETATEAGIYQVIATLAGDNNYTDATSKPLEFTISKANPEYIGETEFTATYEDKLSSIELPDGLRWKDGSLSVGDAGTHEFEAIYNPDSKNYNDLAVKVKVNVEKANSAVTITTQSLDKVYDGNAVSEPEYTTSGSDGKVTITWQEKSTTVKAEWKDLDTAPSAVGNYRVVVTVAGNDNYNSANATLEFVISETENIWTEVPSITGWTYGDKANTPTAKAQFGDVTFTYSDKKNGTYTNEVPKNAGTYYVKASVAGTENYTGLEKILEFTISKANPEYKGATEFKATYKDQLSSIELPDGLRWKDGSLSVGDAGTHEFEAVYNPDSKNYNDLAVKVKVYVEKGILEDVDVPQLEFVVFGTTLKDVKLPKGYAWEDDSLSLDKVGKQTFNVIYTPEDSNYEVVSLKVEVEVIPVSAEDNENIEVPAIDEHTDIDNIVIKDGDKVLEQGKDYDITVVEKDGKVTVTIAFKGNYTGTIEQTYTKTPETTIKPDSDNKKPEKPNKDDAGVETGNHVPVGLWSFITMLSLGAIAFVLRKKYSRR